MIPLLRYYQDQIQPRLPAAVLVPVGLYAVFAVAGTHDFFAKYRAGYTAIQELRAAGVPPTQIDGGTEYNGWNQIELGQFIHEVSVPITEVAYNGRLWKEAKKSFGVCRPVWLERFPAISPRYGLGDHPTDCLGAVAGFAPVEWTPWLTPNKPQSIYIVKVGKPDQSNRQVASGQ